MKMTEIFSEENNWKGAQGNWTLWNVLSLDLDGGFTGIFVCKIHLTAYFRLVHFTVYRKALRKQWKVISDWDIYTIDTMDETGN